MQIIECEQLSEEWMQARLGSIGGSSIASVVAGGQGKMRKNLMYRLAGEILSGEKYESYSNQHMERGIEQEAKAKDLYQFVTGNKVEQVGLVKDSDHKHFSPDGLVGDDGIIEIKCVIPSVHIETIMSDCVPSAYRKQCAWGQHICQRKWVDFVSYSPLIEQKPIWIYRYTSAIKIIKELDEGADKFIKEMLEIVDKIKK